MAFLVIWIIICVGIIIFASVKLYEGIKLRKSVFALDENQINAVKSICFTEIRSESSLNDLQNVLKPAVSSKLASPASAILCSPAELSIEEKDGKFIVKGFVDSQNGFGAMLRTNFRAKCVYDPDCKFWMVENVFVY